MTIEQRFALVLILKNTLSACELSIDGAHYDKDDRYQFTIAILLLRIYEQACAILTLLQSELDSSIPPIIRVILETSMDLICLTKDPEFLNVMLKEYIKQERKILNIRKGNPDHLLNQMYTDESLKIAFADLEKQSSCIPEDTPEYKIIDNFKKAGYEEEYDFVYRLLSSFTHNNLIGVVDRHVIYENDQLTIFKPLNFALANMMIDSLCGLLIFSFNAGFKALNLPITESLKAASEALVTYRISNQ